MASNSAKPACSARPKVPLAPKSWKSWTPQFRRGGKRFKGLFRFETESFGEIARIKPFSSPVSAGIPIFQVTAVVGTGTIAALMGFRMGFVASASIR